MASVYGEHLRAADAKAFHSVLESLPQLQTACAAGLNLNERWRQGTAFGLQFSFCVGRYASVQVLDYLAASHKELPCIDAICIGATNAGQLQTLQWLHSTGHARKCAFTRIVADAALKRPGCSASILILKWLFSEGLLTNSEEGLADLAARAGNTQGLRWLMANGFLDCLSCDTAAAAARSGSLSAVQFLMNFHCPYDAVALAQAAAESDSLELLQWLQERRIGQWDHRGYDSMLLKAGCAGAVKTEQWLQEQSVIHAVSSLSNKE